MKQGLFQSQQLRQEMKLSPRMMQALRFLQAPLPELHELLREELAQNPVLEEKVLEPEVALAQSEPTSPTLNEADHENDYEPDDFGREIDEFEKMLAPRSLEKSEGGPPSAEANAKRQFFMDSLTAPISLYDHLDELLNESGLDDDLKNAGKYIIGNVDENGFLTADLAEVAREAGVPEWTVEKALGLIQEFDPPGVAARDLKECLLIQLQRQGCDSGCPAAQLIEQHLDLFAEQSVEELAKASGLKESEVSQAMRQVSTLDPKPGLRFSSTPSIYVTPEVEILQTAEGTYVVKMLRDGLPRLRISSEYEAMLENPETAVAARKYLNEKIRSGRFLVDSLQQRRDTIRRIAEQIAAAQGEFFKKGISRLRPMTMGSVAEKLGVHETTVGRAVSGKYVRTPQGVFELKFFFTAGLKTADGGSISTEAVKKAVARLIGNEDLKHPLSDQDIADQLKGKGICVARRTVAKYREQLGVPPSHKRK